MADSPKEAEAAQALFCAIVDLKGTPFPSNIPNYLEFKQKYKREIGIVRRKVVTPGVSQNGIEKLLLGDNDWFLSSIRSPGGVSVSSRDVPSSRPSPPACRCTGSTSGRRGRSTRRRCPGRSRRPSGTAAALAPLSVAPRQVSSIAPVPVSVQTSLCLSFLDPALILRAFRNASRKFLAALG